MLQEAAIMELLLSYNAKDVRLKIEVDDEGDLVVASAVEFIDKMGQSQTKMTRMYQELGEHCSLKMIGHLLRFQTEQVMVNLLDEVCKHNGDVLDISSLLEDKKH